MPDDPMTPLTTPERLAVLESLTGLIREDVAEIKRDVKDLARLQSTLATDLATKTATIATDLAAKTAVVATNLAVEQGHTLGVTSSSASVGVWVRAVVPWLFAGMGLLATLIALVNQ